MIFLYFFFLNNKRPPEKTDLHHNGRCLSTVITNYLKIKEARRRRAEAPKWASSSCFIVFFFFFWNSTLSLMNEKLFARSSRPVPLKLASVGVATAKLGAGQACRGRFVWSAFDLKWRNVLDMPFNARCRRLTLLQFTLSYQIFHLKVITLSSIDNALPSSL